MSRLVDGIWIRRRMDGLDRRYQARAGRPDRRASDAVDAEIRAEARVDAASRGFRQRTSNAALFPAPSGTPLAPVVTIAIAPTSVKPDGAR